MVIHPKVLIAICTCVCAQGLMPHSMHSFRAFVHGYSVESAASLQWKPRFGENPWHPRISGFYNIDGIDISVKNKARIYLCATEKFTFRSHYATS